MERASCSSKRPIPFIPIDIIDLILLRVPARSLLRFRCVCKDWCNLIDSFSFVRNQVSIASQQPQVVLAANNFPLSYKSFTFNGNVLKESSRFPILEFSYRNNKCLDYIHAGEVGFGFTCFQNRYRPGEAFLFNPFRRQVLVLPMATCIGQRDWYGMGIDSTTNTYKIVHFVSSVDTDSLAAEIYTLGTKSPWRQISLISPFPFHGSSVDHITGVSTHGDMHWTDRCKIISFDFQKEQFKVTPHPPDFGYKSFLLTSLRGCLAAVVSFSETQAEIWDSEIQAETWVMKDYKKKIWVKEYKISMNTDHPKFWDYDCNVASYSSHWIFVDGMEHDHKFLLDLYETTSLACTSKSACKITTWLPLRLQSTPTHFPVSYITFIFDGKMSSKESSSRLPILEFSSRNNKMLQLHSCR
ncbi:hypothetical protein Ddye_003515 [Dipteronia dyeriana]|uniref:F-box domain-containing protein n=1 Tax=Dipteronia dyeriana TaxID=168575 RepID=A0AAD9XT22_9ROSI|nr:hypothetical protein Ddye_003515 [Dipteronia dyeriana]